MKASSGGIAVPSAGAAIVTVSSRRALTSSGVRVEHHERGGAEHARAQRRHLRRANQREPIQRAAHDGARDDH